MLQRYASAVPVLRALCLLPLAACGRDPGAAVDARRDGAVPQEAYVWQRQWSPEVVAAMGAAAEAGVAGFCLLVADLTVASDGEVEEAVVEPDWEGVARLGLPVGLAVRAGGSGVVSVFDGGQAFVEAAGAALDDAAAAGVGVTEIQVDIDCPTSKLAHYGRWLDGLGGAIRGRPLVPTALPTWLENPEGFASVVGAVDRYVLQVHALELPRSPEAPVPLCDPEAAWEAVEAAAGFGTPFRVALPTYASGIVFDGDGNVVDVFSEDGPARGGAVGLRTVLVEADPEGLARLVASWQASRPASLEGLIWYRLPVPGDRMNWRAVTWDAVRDGRVPRADLRVRAERSAEGLWDLRVENAGDGAGTLRGGVTARWDASVGPPVAVDGTAAFHPVLRRAGRVRWELRENAPVRLAPGAAAPVGWLRVDAAVDAELSRQKMEAAAGQGAPLERD